MAAAAELEWEQAMTTAVTGSADDTRQTQDELAGDNKLKEDVDGWAERAAADLKVAQKLFEFATGDGRVSFDDEEGNAETNADEEDEDRAIRETEELVDARNKADAKADADAKAVATAAANAVTAAAVAVTAAADAMSAAKTKLKAEAETRVAQAAKAEAKAEAEAEAKAEAEAEADATAKAEAEAEAKAKAEADATAKAEAKAEAQAEADATAKAEAQAEAQAEADANAKPKADADAKAEAKAEAEATANAKAEAEAEATATATANAKAEPNPKSPSPASNKSPKEPLKASKRAKKTGVSKFAGMLDETAVAIDWKNRATVRPREPKTTNGFVTDPASGFVGAESTKSDSNRAEETTREHDAGTTTGTDAGTALSSETTVSEETVSSISSKETSSSFAEINSDSAEATVNTLLVAPAGADALQNKEAQAPIATPPAKKKPNWDSDKQSFAERVAAARAATPVVVGGEEKIIEFREEPTIAVGDEPTTDRVARAAPVVTPAADTADTETKPVERVGRVETKQVDERSEGDDVDPENLRPRLGETVVETQPGQPVVSPSSVVTTTGRDEVLPIPDSRVNTPVDDSVTNKADRERYAQALRERRTPWKYEFQPGDFELCTPRAPTKGEFCSTPNPMTACSYNTDTVPPPKKRSGVGSARTTRS